jgi:hypothetical protein
MKSGGGQRAKHDFEEALKEFRRNRTSGSSLLWYKDSRQT